MKTCPPPKKKKKKKNHGFLLFVLPWHDDMIQYIYIERHLYSTGKLYVMQYEMYPYD